ncbi:MAG: hypothetical protein WBJ87_07755, partial [Candidatus Hydrothermia bacterium]
MKVPHRIHYDSLMALNSIANDSYSLAFWHSHSMKPFQVHFTNRATKKLTTIRPINHHWIFCMVFV